MAWRPTTILLADDTADIRRRVAELLVETETVDVVAEAGDAAGALLLFTQHRPDVAVVDLEMPGGGALELLRRMREIQPDCLLILLTATESDALRRRCHKAGVDQVVHKFTEIDTIVSLVKARTCPT